MKHGYGMNREPKALIDAGAERLWIDHDASGRTEREFLFGPMGARDGETIILLDRADLGIGREASRFEALAERNGVSVVVVAKESPTRLKAGRKPGFVPTPEQAARCKHWWQGPFRRADALREIAKIMGRAVSPDQLNRRIGLRGGGKLK